MIGSLVLGHKKKWQISIDKSTRVVEEFKEAEDLLEAVNDMDYDTMFIKTKKE